MHVSIHYHRRVVFALVGVLVVLAAALAALLLKSDLLDGVLIPSPEEYALDPSSEYLEAPASPFLAEEEVVIIEPETEEEEEVVLPVQKVLFEYVEIVEGCGPYFEGTCINARSGPGIEYPVVNRLRNNIVLKVGGKVERNGEVWYKIVFDELLRYPERVEEDWYVAAQYVKVLLDEGDQTMWDSEVATTTKKIIVDRSEQMLYAYEDDELFMQATISTGIELTPTPRGTFSIFKKTPSRYMQGPIPGITNKHYDLPGVPWNLYFTHGGAVIHGTYWHDNFGQPWSNGCVNLVPKQARTLYTWAELGTKVIVQD